MKYPPLGSIVRVDWLDAWLDSHESVPELWGDEAPIVTYGVLVRVTPALISVAAERTSPREYRCVSHIPRSLIQRVRRLR